MASLPSHQNKKQEKGDHSSQGNVRRRKQPEEKSEEEEMPANARNGDSNGNEEEQVQQQHGYTTYAMDHGMVMMTEQGHQFYCEPLVP